MKLKNAIFFLVGAVVSLAVLFVCDRGRPVPSTSPQWLDRATNLTMPNRREYALPLNNPDVVFGRNATHMQNDDLVVGLR